MSKSDNVISIKQLIDIAINFEEESAQFYRYIRSIAKNKTLVSLAQMLEKEENEHQQMLRDIQITDDKSMVTFPLALIESMPSLNINELNVQKLIAIAIEREHVSASIYEQAAVLTGGRIKKLLENLTLFEREHEEKLQRLESVI